MSDEQSLSMLRIADSSRVPLLVAFILAVTAITPQVAQACDCAIPRERATLVAHILDKADIVVFGRVLSARQTTRRRRFEGWSSDPLVEARVEITRRVKGSVSQVISVESAGFDNGANCGIGNWLLAARKTGETISLAMAQRTDRKPYYPGLCWSGRINEADIPTSQ